MSNFNTLWKSLNEDRVNESFGDPIPKEFKDSINKTVDKLKDISDGISKSIGYLNRMKRDLTGGESINDIEERKAEIIKKLSEFSKLDFESILGMGSVSEELNEGVGYNDFRTQMTGGDYELGDDLLVKIDSNNLTTTGNGPYYESNFSGTIEKGGKKLGEFTGHRFFSKEGDEGHSFGCEIWFDKAKDAERIDGVGQVEDLTKKALAKIKSHYIKES